MLRQRTTVLRNEKKNVLGLDALSPALTHICLRNGHTTFDIDDTTIYPYHADEEHCQDSFPTLRDVKGHARIQTQVPLYEREKYVNAC